MQITKYISRQSIGASLVACGVPYGMYFNFLYPNGLRGIPWSPIFMTLSIILLTDWGNMLRLKFPSFSKILGFIILFQILMLFYGALSFNMTSQLLSFHLYVLALCLSTSTIKDYTKLESFPITLFVVSLPLVAWGVYYTVLGYFVGETAYQMQLLYEDYALEPFTACTGVLTNMFAIMCVRSKSLIYKICVVLSFAAGFYVIIFSGKRTPLLDLFVALFIYMFMRNRLDKKTFQRLGLYGIGAILVITVLVAIVPSIRDQAGLVWDNFTAGIRNMLGDTTVSDTGGSALARYTSRQWAYDYINTHFTTFNWFFGAGYMTKWLDNPLLQSYLDMGILGFVFYLGIVAIYPIRIILKRYNDTNVILAVMLASYSIVSIFNSGHPYGWLRYSPVILVALFVVAYRKSLNDFKKNGARKYASIANTND